MVYQLDKGRLYRSEGLHPRHQDTLAHRHIDPSDPNTTHYSGIELPCPQDMDLKIYNKMHNKWTTLICIYKPKSVQFFSTKILYDNKSKDIVF